MRISSSEILHSLTPHPKLAHVLVVVLFPACLVYFHTVLARALEKVRLWQTCLDFN